MSKLAEFRAAERALQEHLAQLESLKKDAALKKELEFEEKLLALMQSYDKGLRDIVAILDPEPVSVKSGKAARGPQRRQRAVKVYKNPETGEVVETKGGNHKVLKAWKEKYGAEKVEGWLQA